jgi:outer membrane protein OmpA-like peptidoglycan-associated protein
VSKEKILYVETAEVINAENKNTESKAESKIESKIETQNFSTKEADDVKKTKDEESVFSSLKAFFGFSGDEDDSNVKTKSDALLEESVVVNNEDSKIVKDLENQDVITQVVQENEYNSEIQETLPAKLPDTNANALNVDTLASVVAPTVSNAVSPVEDVTLSDTVVNKASDTKSIDSVASVVPVKNDKILVADDKKETIVAAIDEKSKNNNKNPISLDDLLAEDKDTSQEKNSEQKPVLSKNIVAEPKEVKEIFSAPYEDKVNTVKTSDKSLVKSATDGAEPQLVIKFNSDDVDLTTSETDRLSEFVRNLLNSNRKIKIVSYGPADENEVNISRRISLKRAIAVRAAVMANGLASGRINVQAVGVADNPYDSNTVNVFIIG